MIDKVLEPAIEQASDNLGEFWSGLENSMAKKTHRYDVGETVYLGRTEYEVKAHKYCTSPFPSGAKEYILEEKNSTKTRKVSELTIRRDHLSTHVR